MQALRTQFAVSADGPRQVILPASAIRVSTATLPKNGSALLQQHAAGGVAVRAGSSLAAAWQEAVVQPFDLYKDTLTRIKVSIFQPILSDSVRDVARGSRICCS